MEIRAMKDSDWPRMAEIYKSGIETGVATFQDTVPEFDVWDKGHHKFCRLVAEIDGVVCGFAVISPTSARACYRGVAEVSVYIDEGYRGHGVGYALLEALIDCAEAHDMWQLYSSVFEKNTASRKLHSKCGFRFVGYRERIAQDVNGEWQNTCMYELRF